jgi:hypothetical protein
MDSEFREVGEPDERLRSALLYQLGVLDAYGTTDLVSLTICGVRTTCGELMLLLNPPPAPEQPAPSPMAVPGGARLTAGELALINKLGECWNDLLNLMTPEVPAFSDRREALSLIHQLQLLVMARLAARSHPDIFG